MKLNCIRTCISHRNNIRLPIHNHAQFKRILERDVAHQLGVVVAQVQGVLSAAHVHGAGEGYALDCSGHAEFGHNVRDGIAARAGEGPGEGLPRFGVGVFKVHRIFQHKGAETFGGECEVDQPAFAVRHALGLDFIDSGSAFLIGMDMVQLVGDLIDGKGQAVFPVALQHIHANRNSHLVFFGGDCVFGQVDFIGDRAGNAAVEIGNAGPGRHLPGLDVKRHAILLADQIKQGGKIVNGGDRILALC